VRQAVTVRATDGAVREVAVLDGHQLGGISRFAVDGNRIATARAGSCGGDIWVRDLVANTWAPLMRGGEFSNVRPEWAPDGQRVVFLRESPLSNELWIQRSDGNTPATRLQAKTSTEPEPYGGMFSPDGNYLIFRTEEPGSGGSNLWYRKTHGDTTRLPFAVDSAARETQPTFSRDGGWVAYLSNRTGSPEVYVRSFPQAGRVTQVSRGNAVAPMWAPTSRKLYFMSGTRMMEALLAFDPEPRVTSLRALFATDLDCGGVFHRQCDVSPDGSQFIGTREVSAAVPGAVTLIHAWAAGVGSRPSRR
jgi:Tol biopolymer transport system component